MTNAVIWGFDGPNKEIINILKNRGFNIVAHFLEKPAKANEYSYSDLHSGQNLPEIFLKAPQKIKSKLAELFLKDYLIFNIRQSNLEYAELGNKRRDSFADFHLFYYLIDVFYGIIKKNDAKLVIFSNLPHEGADFILYQVAQALEIKTILCYQSIFDNRLFMINKLSDMGDLLNTVPALEEPLNITIKKEFEKKLQYMDMVEDVNQHRKKILKKITNIRKKTPKILWKLLRGKTTSVNTILINYACALLRLKNIDEYSDTLKKCETADIDFTKKFIYFPLHLQPEITTTPLGGKYYDQINALEKLSEILPDDFKIYVKENPKQNELMRPKEFLARMMSIKNVIMAPIKTNTYDLTKNCQFVATITGTAGWEAITGGKNVLTFGYAWYNNLPGVFKFEERENVSEILEYKINHDELQQKFNELSKRLVRGYVDKEFINYSDQPFDGKENSASLANGIEKFWQIIQSDPNSLAYLF